MSMEPRFELISESCFRGDHSSPPLYVINLDQRCDRLAKILDVLNEYEGPVFRYSAIDTRSKKAWSMHMALTLTC